MKVFILTTGFLAFFSVLGLKIFFALTPTPPTSLTKPISDIFPREIDGWSYSDYDLATSEESSDRIASFLNFDDSMYRVYTNNDIRVGVYIAYWSPGKVSYRWAGAHTPDTCWVVNGWTRLAREYSIPFEVDNIKLKNAEFGIYRKDRTIENVYFWHLVGGEPFGYAQKEVPNIFGSLIDIQKYGLNLRQEQFFIRLSSNKKLKALEATDGFKAIIKGLSQLPLTKPEIVL